MKYVVLLVVLGLVYFFFVRVAPVKEVEPAGALPTSARQDASSPVPGPDQSNVLKRPIDRTRAAVDQAKERRRTEEF